MNITKNYTLFNFMGKSQLAISSLANVNKIRRIYRVNSAGTAWETWDSGLFPAFSQLDPGVGYYLESTEVNPSYEMYNVSESSPSGSFQVTKRYTIQTWNCDNKPIADVSGPSSVYVVAPAGNSFISWKSTSIFNNISNFENGIAHIIFSTGTLPYQLYSCCLVDPTQQLITVESGSNVVSGLGMTLVSSTNNKLYYDVLADYDGLPSQMGIFVSGIQVASVTFNSPYNTRPFVFERNVGGNTTKYCGNFTAGNVNF